MLDLVVLQCVFLECPLPVLEWAVALVGKFVILLVLAMDRVIAA